MTPSSIMWLCLGAVVLTGIIAWAVNFFRKKPGYESAEALTNRLRQNRERIIAQRKGGGLLVNDEFGKSRDPETHTGRMARSAPYYDDAPYPVGHPGRYSRTIPPLHRSSPGSRGENIGLKFDTMPRDFGRRLPQPLKTFTFTPRQLEHVNIQRKLRGKPPLNVSGFKAAASLAATQPSQPYTPSDWLLFLILYEVIASDHQQPMVGMDKGITIDPNQPDNGCGGTFSGAGASGTWDSATGPVFAEIAAKIADGPAADPAGFGIDTGDKAADSIVSTYQRSDAAFDTAPTQAPPDPTPSPSYSSSDSSSSSSSSYDSGSSSSSSDSGSSSSSSDSGGGGGGGGD